MNRKIFSLLISFIISFHLSAQTIHVLNTGSNVSIRGLCVVSDRIIWVSGSNGTIGESLDSGKTWKWMVVKGFEKADFRDVEAFDETSAVIMSVGEPAFILRTSNAGDTWQVVYENNTKGIFLDAMEFWNEQSGIVIGDPIHNKFFIARTFDGGMHWREISNDHLPVADSGEACFAASGTNVCKLDNGEACFVSGGSRSRLFIRDERIDIPFAKGKETVGAYSIAVKNNKTLIVVGGDYLLPDSSSQNCFMTKNAGINWSTPSVSPHGYRSCVEYINNKNWISCGPNGVDYTKNNGDTWTWISHEGFNVCKKAKTGKSVFLAGENGIIAKFIP